MWVEAVGSQDSTYEAVRMPRLAATKAEETLIHVLCDQCRAQLFVAVGTCAHNGSSGRRSMMAATAPATTSRATSPTSTAAPSAAVGLYGNTIRTLRKVTQGTLDKEPRWRTTGSRLTTGATRTW